MIRASAAVLLLVSSYAYALTDARDVEDIGIDEKLGIFVPADIMLNNENGRSAYGS